MEVGTRPMPREMSLHSTSARAAKPAWHDSSASTTSGLAKLPGPRNVRKLSIRRRSAALPVPSSRGASAHASTASRSGAVG
jgi:hypothetical protein